MRTIPRNAFHTLILAGALAGSCFAAGHALANNGGGNGHSNSGGGASSKGNGNSNGNSNSNSSGNSHSNSTTAHTSADSSTGAKPVSASKLGALNAAHASAQAFAHASPNSRIGKIKAYYLANQDAAKTGAVITTDQSLLTKATSDLDAANTALTQLNDTLTADAAALKLDPTNAALTAAVDADKAAIADATTALAPLQANVDALTTQLQTDQAKAATLDASASAALAAASNKPLDAATKLALDAWLASMASKFD